MKVKWENEKKSLKNLIEQGISYEEIGRKYSVSGAAVKKAAKKLGIELKARRVINPSEFKETNPKSTHVCANCGKIFTHNSSSANKFCSLKCFHEFYHKKRYEEFVNGNENVQRANYSPRFFKNDIIEEQKGVCAICGQKPEWNGKPLIFIIDHIDGNAANNTRENVRCICPNCDSQLDTYKSKNKNGARYYYRYGKRK